MVAPWLIDGSKGNYGRQSAARFDESQRAATLMALT